MVGFLNTLDVAVQLEAFEVVTHDDVHNTRYRIGAVECRTTVGQNFDAVSHHEWNRVEVDELTTASGSYSCRNHTLAVNQRECGVLAEVTEVDVCGAFNLAVVRAGIGDRAGVHF